MHNIICTLGTIAPNSTAIQLLNGILQNPEIWEVLNRLFLIHCQYTLASNEGLFPPSLYN